MRSGPCRSRSGPSSCGQPACAHLAAGCLAALDRYPALRKPVQASFLDTLASSEPAVPACGSGPLTRPTHVVIDQDREVLHLLKKREPLRP